jgi:pimeloyl-ACP methyl ester carboxylesterase
MTQAYQPTHTATARMHPLRGGHYQAWHWHSHEAVTPQRPLLVLAHGWMDVGASYQFVVDAMAAPRATVAFDWRGFGGSHIHATDSYWFPDYLGDLDALLDALSPDAPVDLVGHSMGGNVVMSYAAVRPHRIRKLVNLEGFGMPATQADEAPARLARWLDELKTPATLRDYGGAQAVADRLVANNPRLSGDKAAWLAQHWGKLHADGRWHIQGDAAHKRVNPVLSRREEHLALWRKLSMPVLWVEGEVTDMRQWWGDRYPRADFEERLAVVPHLQRHTIARSGHMLHLDQPQRLASVMESFLA